jgi:hypothetical protein
MIQKVRAVQDESSHWYVIPESLNSKFRELTEFDNDEDTNFEYEKEFNEIFRKYRTGGDLNNIQLYADIF